MGDKERQAAWRAMHPEAGLYVMLKRRAKQDGERLTFSRTELGYLWSEVQHKCGVCRAKVDFQYGDGPTSRQRQARFVRDDVFMPYELTNLKLLCADCDKEEF